MKPPCRQKHPLVFILLLLVPASIADWSRVAPQSTSTHLPPSVAIEQNNIGVGHMNQHAFKDAAAAFRKALAADSSFNLARVNLGIALFYDQQVDEARTVLLAAERRERANPYAHFVLGLIYRNRGENIQAEQEFTAVARIDESCSANHYNLGLLYARERRDKEAEAEFRRALELDPNNASAMYNLGGLLIKTGRAQEGNLVLDRFRVLSQKGIPSTGMGSGSQYGEQGEYAMAMDYRRPHDSRRCQQRPRY